MRILVTGATGFIGRAVIPVLLERGHSVRIAARRPEPGLSGCETALIGEIGPDTNWREALKGMEAVVHLAARVHVMRERAADPLAEFRRINVEGTRALAQQAAEEGVPRFLLMSSLHAVTGSSRPDPVTEASAPAPTTAYGRSKLEAERVLAGVRERAGLETVVLRPPLIYGPGVGANFRALLDACWRRLPLPIGGIENRRSLLYVGNLADAIERSLVHPKGAGRAYFLQDGPPVSTQDLVRRIGESLGHKALIIPLPRPVKGILERLGPARVILERLTGSLAVDDASIRMELGWCPPFTLKTGLEITANWYRSGRTTPSSVGPRR